MKKEVTTKYLSLFLLADLLIVGVLLCFFSQKEWWNNWMVTAPNLYMILGALYCPLMKKNLDEQVSRQRWLYLYKGIKMLLTIVMLVLYIFLVKQGTTAFVIITAIAYLIGLIVETYSFLHYLKHLEK
jgi:peptidoglycan/LPS O-acetylase OafA/YrhL